jgi:hypothetical protein
LPRPLRSGSISRNVAEAGPRQDQHQQPERQQLNPQRHGAMAFLSPAVSVTAPFMMNCGVLWNAVRA